MYQHYKNSVRTQTSTATLDPLKVAVRCAIRTPKAINWRAGFVLAGLMGVATTPAMAGPFPAEIELSSLQIANNGDGSKGFVLNGIDAYDQSGFSVSAAGDVNGDGIDDLVVAAPLADPGGRNYAGESYVVFGTASGFAAEIELSSLLAANGGNGSKGFVLNGTDAYDQSGISVSAAGDVNGDGIGDLIVGAHGADVGDAPCYPFCDDPPPCDPYCVPYVPGVGKSYVVFGSNSGFPAEFELSELLSANGGNGSKGFVLNGIDAYDYSGISVRAAGDVNGDGVGDLIVGTNNASPGGRSGAGESYVVFGRASGFLAEFELSDLLAANNGDGSTGFVLNGIDANDFSGYSVSAAGDVNGDGIDDMIVGAFRADPGGRDAAGQSYVVFGRTSGFGAEIELSILLATNGGDGSKGFVMNGIDAGDASGLSVSAVGDVNGDGIGDLSVGAVAASPGGRNRAGESYVVFGCNADFPFPAEFELSGLLAVNGGDGSTGFVLNGIDAEDLLGRSASAAGDVNGDGIGDLIVGANYADPGGRSTAGESYVVFGRTSGFGAEIELSSLLTVNGGDGSTGFVLNGINANDVSGFSVSAAGDVNDDGIGDLIVGARQAGPGGRIGAGESYVVFGRVDTDGDGDGVFDSTDNCPTLANSDQADIDDDGIGNVCDNCTNVANADQCDTNDDGFGNLCDADLDNNGIVNSFDLSILRQNFGQTGDNDADLNCNGMVNSFDLSLMRTMFGTSPGPSGLGSSLPISHFWHSVPKK